MHQMCRICHQGVRHQTMRVIFQQFTSPKKVQNYMDQPASTLFHLHRLINPTLEAEREHQQAIFYYSRGTHNLGYRISQSTKTGIADLREGLASELVDAPTSEAHPSSSGSPNVSMIIRCNPKNQMGKHIHNLFLPSWLKLTELSTIYQKGRKRRRAAPTGDPSPHKPYHLLVLGHPKPVHRRIGRQQCSSEQAKHAKTHPKTTPESRFTVSNIGKPRHRPAPQDHWH